jgi:AraC-like DNA-binding protein
MRSEQTRSSGEGLERSCRRTGSDWIASAGPVGGVELLRAWFGGVAYAKHRHDTYAIGVTDCGIQVFDYRGAARASAPGQAVVLYPDEVHDGRAGTPDGFGYRIVYVEPVQLSSALEVLCGRSYPLPFLRQPVTVNARLSRAVGEAFAFPLESLAVDSLVLALAEELLAGEPGGRPAASPHVDRTAIDRARQFLEAKRTRVVRSAELEAVTGLTRYDLARQFKATLGTSPHRYLLMRRLELARRQLRLAHSLADVACEAGFADQAHFTRRFKSAFGLTPGRYCRLTMHPTADR